jgi:23S rRNA (uracil1939-C5)-methyltransferase
MSEATNMMALQPAMPECRHFGICGGCQRQDVAYESQLVLKREALQAALESAGLQSLPELQTLASPMPYAYRNRIRLRLQRVDSSLRFGYTLPGTRDFLPIEECPIAAPLLLKAAQQLIALSITDAASQRLLAISEEVEVMTDAEEARLMVTLLITQKALGRRDASLRKGDGALRSGDVAAMLHALQQSLPQCTSLALARIDPHSRTLLQVVEAAGADGLSYRVDDETYWVPRGAFFQVNRAVLPQFLKLVTADRSGALAWDLFAGVGLFSRVLARGFERVTAVESSAQSYAALHSALAKLGAQHAAMQRNVDEFLERAVFERDRPELIVMDPPRAGVGERVCELLLRVGAPALVYVSCDPQTLAADLARLSAAYRLDTLHLVDLFPQTTHVETVATLSRRT